MAASVLIAFGFGWMVVAAILGLVLGAKHVDHLDQLERAVSDGDFARYHRELESYKWRSSVHAHGMLFSLSSVGVGLVLAQKGFVANGAEALAGALIAATVVWTPAAMRRIRLLMGLADLLFVGALAWVAVAVARGL